MTRAGAPPGAAALSEKAPAKVNLALHVLGRRADGYHSLSSLVAFAGAADLLAFAPDPELSLTVAGPTARAAGPAEDNLILRAARNLAACRPGVKLGSFSLTKRLPVAAGIGGGSSDAAAALRLLARANDIPPDHPALVEAARLTGADVPVCLRPQMRMMEGAGEVVGPPLGLPPLFAVLVNPRVPVETPSIFRELGLERGGEFTIQGEPARPVIPPGGSGTRADLVAALASLRNDLERPAIAVAPVIAEVLAALRGTADCALARMSGSGATCFGLYPDCHAAARAAHALRAKQPDWWISATLLR
ncbi:4-(cytidine 5'-diphospho)-2-C-methyl-D-erythritol kinase [Alsobacter soli]|uniref:4-diphosphocytidyl-2-C-methyl-D-erythritol kinase n=1 Tax=Alsobacter soli TaxID=2109933 RepID=A0A2T1HSP7_9HYPH|nr:4-(cytidine 5'-diphospho)-2-C-methyl-D-erythritol kinase [Alsobacter soli]PSC04680.1 4-(cytidine 5'-diphospho)-2-C-methyl-D-erythritol kinase [Alsobacter soli]